MALETRSSILVEQSGSRQVVTLGLEDCLVVDTDDIVFVAARSRLPLMKSLLDRIEQLPQGNGGSDE